MTPDARAVDRSRRARRAVDVVAPLVLAAVALHRRWSFPSDGLFYDDSWSALAGAAGDLGNLRVAGQAQPGFTLVLMAWERLAGSGPSAMVVPALVAGVLGPPALYLALRRLGAAAPVALACGAVLVGSSTHVAYSGRVKPYVAEVLVVLALLVVVPALARRRWSPVTGAAWAAAGVVLALHSAFALLAAACAGAVLALHPRADRRIRWVAVGCQALVTAAAAVVMQRTYSVSAVRGFWSSADAYLDLDTPWTLPWQAVVHASRVVETYTDGPRWSVWCVLVVAAAGVVWGAVRGPEPVAARFALALALLAAAGSAARTVPFGPRLPNASRASLWLVPVVVLGLVTVAGAVGRLLAPRWRQVAGAGLVLGAAAVLVAGGDRSTYPRTGALALTHHVMDELRAGDVVLVERQSIYSFALEAGVPVRLDPRPDQPVGYLPDFDDERLVPLTFDVTDREVRAAVTGADRVLLVGADMEEAVYEDRRARLARILRGAGFDEDRTEAVEGDRVQVWVPGG